jgi:hypothetical protein
MLLFGVAIFLVGVASGAPGWFLLGSAALTVGLAVVDSKRRERRRREQYRRWREWAEQAEREKQARRAARQAARRSALKARTGLDADLVAAAVQDVAGRSGARVRAAGERVNRLLELRYGGRAGSDAAAPTPSVDPRDGWLDLDTELAALEARRRTDEALRLSEQLGDNLRGSVRR